MMLQSIAMNHCGLPTVQELHGLSWIPATDAHLWAQDESLSSSAYVYWHRNQMSWVQN